jgi:hypothetical protein
MEKYMKKLHLETLEEPCNPSEIGVTSTFHSLWEGGEQTGFSAIVSFTVLSFPSLMDCNGICAGTLTDGAGKTLTVSNFRGTSSYNSLARMWQMSGVITDGVYANYAINMTAQSDGTVTLRIDGCVDGEYVILVDDTADLHVDIHF